MKKRASIVSRRWLTIVAFLIALLSLPLPALAHGPSGGGGAEAFNTTFIIVLAIAIPIFLLVQGLLIFAVIRYRRRSNNEMPRQITGNRALELTWTIGSFVIIIVLFGITVAALAADPGPPDNAMPIEVIGRQFYWEFRYPETGVTLLNRLRIPAERPVRLDITAADVQHSFWVPEWGGKVDAIPGRVNSIWFDFHETGALVARCAEYCGSAHAQMLADVEIIPGDEFDAWMAEQVARSRTEAVGRDLDTPLPQGNAADGEVVFFSYHCDACHSLTGEDRASGPTLLDIGARAGARVEGLSAGQYLRQAIIQPCDEVVEGYSCIMRQDYGDQITPQQLADLIEWLKQQ